MFRLISSNLIKSNLKQKIQSRTVLSVCNNNLSTEVPYSASPKSDSKTTPSTPECKTASSSSENSIGTSNIRYYEEQKQGGSDKANDWNVRQIKMNMLYQWLKIGLGIFGVYNVIIGSSAIIDIYQKNGITSIMIKMGKKDSSKPDAKNEPIVFKHQVTLTYENPPITVASNTAPPAPTTTPEAIKTKK